MTARANHRVQSVRGASNVGAAQRFAVTPQTIVEYLARRQLRERDDGCLAAMRLDMGLAGPMTAFASGPLRRFVTGCDAFEMWIFVESGPHVRMAGAAWIAAHEP